MARREAGFVAAAILALLVFALAFVAAPRSCEGGLELYVWSGLAALAIWGALPFLSGIGGTLTARTGWAFCFVAAGTGVWLAGFALANVRLLCRLF